MYESENDIAIIIGRRIRAERKKYKLTQETLADRCVPPLNSSYLGEVERGEKSITAVKLRSIAIALDVSLDYLTKMPDAKQSKMMMFNAL